MGMILYVFILQGLVWASSEYFKNSVELPKFDIPIVQDELFGELECIHGYFYNDDFKYKNKFIYIKIYQESTLPTQIQRDFYLKIENEIDAIINTLKPQIHALVKKELDITLDNEEVISLQSILIPRSDKKKWAFSVIFSTLDDFEAGVQLDNNQILSITLDFCYD
jgi:hypothetical protein